MVMIFPKTSSALAAAVLASATFDMASAIILPENVIPSVTTKISRRQASSQCSQTLIPLTRSCSTPDAKKRDEPEPIEGAALPGSPVVRDAPTSTCSQVYTTFENCSPYDGADYAGTTYIIPPSNTIPGLPGGTTPVTETAALMMNACPTNSKLPWEVQITPEMRNRILEIADGVCSSDGKKLRIRQGSDLNGPACTFHILSRKAKQDFHDHVKIEIDRKFYYPVNPVSDPFILDCLPDWFGNYEPYEQLAAEVVAAGLGYLFDLGYPFDMGADLWATFNIPAEIGSSALSAASESSSVSSPSSSSSSGSTEFESDTAGNPPSNPSSSSTRRNGHYPGTKPTKTSSKTRTTSSTSSSADACPTDIRVDPNEDQGQDGPRPTAQVPLIPHATTTFTGKFHFPCTALPAVHNHACNVCECVDNGATLTVPMSHGTYAVPINGKLETRTNDCFYQSWPDTKTISTTSCPSPEELSMTKDLQSLLSSISAHLHSDATPGAPLHTCSFKPHHPMPICDLKNANPNHEKLRDPYCKCPAGLYSTTSTSLVSCDLKLGTVTPLDVCPWTIQPPDSMKITMELPGATYTDGTMPPVQTTTAACNPRGYDEPGFEEWYLRNKIKLFCMNAEAGKWQLGQSLEKEEWHYIWSDTNSFPNGVGKVPFSLRILAQWDQRACPADWDGLPFAFAEDDEQCMLTFFKIIRQCPSIRARPYDHLPERKMYYYAGGLYENCIYWEIKADRSNFKDW